MIRKMFSVLDAKAGIFGIPFCEQRDETAIRAFADAVNDSSNPHNMWNRHPEDFALYQVGEYEDNNGRIEPLEVIRCLVTASALRSLYKNGVPPPDAINDSEMPLFKNNGKEEAPIKK